MTDRASSKFDDDDVNDDDLLAACAEDSIPTDRSTTSAQPGDRPSLSVPVPSSFGFPFEPYHIQFDFMRGLYSTLQQRKHGIFESPTGTVNLRNSLGADRCFSSRAKV